MKSGLEPKVISNTEIDAQAKEVFKNCARLRGQNLPGESNLAGERRKNG